MTDTATSPTSPVSTITPPRRRRRIVTLLIIIVVIAFALYWLTRPETFRPPTPQIAQVIPAGVPTGQTIFLNVSAGALDRFEMFYRTAGDPQNPPVLLLHGIQGASDTTWFNTFPALAEAYYVIAPDLRGHGLTMQPPGEMSIAQMADDVYALLTALDITNVHVVGHSMGGLVAMQFTHTHPERVRSLTLMDTAATFNDGIVGALMPAYPAVVRLRNRTVGWQNENRDRAAGFSTEVEPQYHEWVWQKRMFNQTEPYLAAWMAIVNFSAVEFLPSITQPVLIVYGENESLISKELQDRLIGLLPNPEVAIIPGGDHYPQVEFAAEVNPVLLDFLGRN